jgi:hypothetical protein
MIIALQSAVIITASIFTLCSCTTHKRVVISPFPDHLHVCTIAETDEHVIVKPTGIVQVSDTTVLICQHLNGPLFVVDVRSGSIVTSVSAPLSLIDSASLLAGKRLRQIDADFYSLDQALHDERFATGRNGIPSFALPRWAHIHRSADGKVSGLLQLYLPHVSNVDGQAKWALVVGIAELSSGAHAIEKFTLLEVRDERYPQFFYYTSAAEGGWWVSSYNWVGHDLYGFTGLSIMTKYHSVGAMGNDSVPVPTYNYDLNPFIHMRNQVLDVSDTIKLLIDTDHGTMIVANVNGMNSKRASPFVGVLPHEMIWDSVTAFHDATVRDSNRFELVVSHGNDANKRSTNTYVVIGHVDTRSQDVDIIRLYTLENGTLVGPACQTSEQLDKVAKGSVIRMMMSDDKWSIVCYK